MEGKRDFKKEGFMKTLLGFLMVMGLIGCGSNGGGAGSPSRAADPSTPGPSATWQLLGTFTDNSEWTHPQIRVYNDGGTAVPYLAYTNADTGFLYVKKYTGGSWQAVGSPVACDINATCEFDFFVYDNAGSPVPYIVYNNGDGDNFLGLIVQGYVDGSGWVTVGTGTAVRNAWYPSLFVYNNIPYLAFSDYNAGDAVTVIKYDGGWSTVGGAAAYSNGSYPGYMRTGSIYVADASNVYIGFATNVKAYVMKYNGTSWGYIGNGGNNWLTPTAEIDSLSLTYNNSFIFVAYIDTSDYKARLSTGDGTDWQTSTVSSSTAEEISLAANSSTPYTIFIDYSASGTTVMEGTSTVLGSKGFNSSQTYLNSISMFGSVPYVALVDGGDLNKVKVYFYE